MEFYDVGTSDLRELWDSYFVDSSLGQDGLMGCTGKYDDWSVLGAPAGLMRDCAIGAGVGAGGKQASFGVVLRDRLMTDAALGGPNKPIKTEHSYSLLASSPPHGQGHQEAAGDGPAPEGLRGQRAHHQQHQAHQQHQHQAHQQQHHQQHQQHQQQQQQQHHHHHPQQHHHHHHATAVSDVYGDAIVCGSEPSRIDVTDMEEECYPAISMNTASGRDSAGSSPEHFAAAPPRAIRLPRPASSLSEDGEAGDVCAIIKGEPLSAPCSPCTSDPAMLLEERGATVAISPHSLHLNRFAPQTSDSEDEDEEMQQEFKVETLELPSEDDVIDQTSSQELPPTPPSSASSDSEGTVSASCSPERRDSHGSVHVQNLRGFLQPRLYVTTSGTFSQHATSTRQPIHTPLISCQPKGSTGALVLTEEEKRTLIAEGYPVPTKLPLTKQEEKSLKKVRRKIKNKISAQESRRKKKEYMDGLERRVTVLTNENCSYREKVSSLESTNRQLLKELQRLQALIQQKSS